MAVVTAVYEHVKNPLAEESPVGIAERLAIAGAGFWFYVGKLVAPVRLAFVYEKWPVDARTLGAFLPAVGVIATGAALWAVRRRWGLGPFLAFVFFVVGLFPVLGVFRFYYQKISYVADHFQYLPSLGLIALFVGAACHWMARRNRRVLGTGAATIVVALLWFLTWKQCHLYKDNFTIWQDTLSKSPGSWVAHGMFARAAAGRGDTDTAIFHYGEEIKRGPQGARAYSDLGRLLQQLGRVEEAEATFEAGISAHPRFPGPYLLLADLYVGQGRFEDAVTLYEQILQLPLARRPAGVHHRLAIALRKCGRPKEAAVHLRKARELSDQFGAGGRNHQRGN